MLKLCVKLPRKIAVGVSGGIDSMVAAHFLSRNHDVTVYSVDYGSEFNTKAIEMIANTFPNVKASQKQERPPSNKEATWRKQRLAIFKQWHEFDKLPIVLGHHLQDAAETYLMSCLIGTPSGRPKHLGVYGPSHTVRPFLLNDKRKIIEYAAKYNVPYLDDPTNLFDGFMRNKVRHNLMPQVLQINKGFLKTVKRQLETQIKKEESNG